MSRWVIGYVQGNGEVCVRSWSRRSTGWRRLVVFSTRPYNLLYDARRSSSTEEGTNNRARPGVRDAAYLSSDAKHALLRERQLIRKVEARSSPLDS